MDLAFSMHSEYLQLLTGVLITFTFNMTINMVGLNLQSYCFLCPSLVWFIFPPFWPFKKFNYFYDSPLFPFRFVATVGVKCPSTITIAQRPKEEKPSILFQDASNTCER